MLKWVPVSSKRPDAAHRQVDHVGKHHGRIEQRAECQVQHDQDHAQRERDDPHQPRFGLLHLLELSAPDGAVGRLEQVLGHFLGFGNGAGQIAAADAELDGDQTITLLAIDRRRAGTQKLAVRIGLPLVVERRHQVDQTATRHAGAAAQRGVELAAGDRGHVEARAGRGQTRAGSGERRGGDRGDGTAGHLVLHHVDRDVQDFFFVVAEPLGPAQRDVEGTFAFDHLGKRLAADGRFESRLRRRPR